MALFLPKSLGKSLMMLLLLGVCAQAAQISIVYPLEGDTLRAASYDSAYIFGQVVPSNARLLINETPVRVYKNGAFMAFLPLSTGDFNYRCRLIADEVVEVNRRIFVEKPAPMPGDRLAIDRRSVEPRLDHRLLPGDRIMIALNGTPGMRAYFRIDDGPFYPMRENETIGEPYWAEAAFGAGNASVPPLPGRYTGTYILQPEDRFIDAAVQVMLVNAAGDSDVAEAPGRVSIWPLNPPQMAETVERTVLRAGRSKSYYYFWPKNVRCRLTGQVGSSYRIGLADGEEAWAESRKLRRLPEGTSWPPVLVRVVRTADFSDWTRVRVYTGSRVPFRVEQNVAPQSLKIFFYGVTADTDWMRRQGTDEIGHLVWRQEASDVYSLEVHLRAKQQWGWRADYDDYGFYIDIKKPPQHGFKGLTVLLDPGHSPDSGAVGPTGLMEKDANLALARAVAAELHRRGALVEWTRQAEGISLAERARLAERSNADVLLSLHHNAVPDGINPLRHHGSSVYYYHPQSYELARRIHQKLLEKLKLPDFGLYYDNLAMCRSPNMPAVLIEPAFMIHPVEEALIRTPVYGRVCARAIADGLADFLKTFRE